MKAFVISLATSTDRRTHVKEHMGMYDIDFEFINAVNGQNDEHPFLQRYQPQSFIYNYGRKAVPGEIGCYASHMLAWEKCVQLDEPILVFEDDFQIVSDEIKNSIQACEKKIEKLGFIRIETTRNKPKYKVSSIDNYTFYNYLKVPQCATGYIISPEVARQFLDNSQTISLPVDVFIRNVWIHKQPIYGVEPYSVSPRKIDSIIGSRKVKDKKTIKEKAIRIGYKIRNILFNTCYQIKFYFHN
ncbi:glycosyltransferase family 25 protein [Photobacterium minamisatsumaniensis]|uniref:glycosyltransferase family 25 protein n=1 Tax=Photobacterium minamisatsumaniensis TaxID=2910233 RepID=UPI003D0A3A95